MSFSEPILLLSIRFCEVFSPVYTSAPAAVGVTTVTADCQEDAVACGFFSFKGLGRPLKRLVLFLAVPLFKKHVLIQANFKSVLKNSPPCVCWSFSLIMVALLVHSAD